MTPETGATESPRRGTAGWWDDRYAEGKMLWSYEPNRFVVEEAAGLPPGRAVDLACGEGRNAIWLAGLGWQVTAVDFSAVALGTGRRLAAEARVDVDWVEADVLGWRPHWTYDLVLLAYLQLREPERRQALSTAEDATAPGGSLLVVAHDVRNLAEGTGGPQYPELLWTPGEVTRPGFTVARSGTATRSVDGGTSALDTVVRLVRDG